MAQVNPYFTFNGNCEEAFNFYKSAFGGEYVTLMRFRDVQTESKDIPEKDLDKIMHVSLPISKETVIMGSDAHPLYGPVVVGQHLSVSINTDSKDEAAKLFNALSAGGQVTMPLGDTFWGAYFGMFNDKFGIIWMVNYDERQK